MTQNKMKLSKKLNNGFQIYPSNKKQMRLLNEKDVMPAH